MLKPDYLASCTDEILGLYDELDRAIIEDIARRIVKTGGISATAEHQIDKVMQSGMLLTDVTKQISNVNAMSEQAVNNLFNEAGLLGLRNDAQPLILAGIQVDLQLSPTMLQILEASIAKTNGDLKNLTLTTGTTATNAYMQAVNAAYMKVQSGAFSYQTAIRDAIKRAATDGNYVSYSSGHRSQLDVAVRRSVLTGINQTAGKLTEMYASDMGAEYYETSAHAGARPSHALWQGRIFKIEGATAEYPNFEDETGYGTGDGLCGWNCRHSFYPFWIGLSQPAYTADKLAWYDAPRFEYNGDKLTEYEVSQLMRANEREIRATKRELAAYRAAIEASTDRELTASLQTDFDQSSMNLKNLEAKYKDLCKQTKHKTDSTRTGVVAIKDSNGKILSWNQSTAQRAIHGAERAFQKVISGTGADIGGPQTLAKRNELRYNNKQESELYDRYLKQVKNGTISPLSTFGNYKNQYMSVENKIVGTTTSNGIHITGQSKHFIERVIGTVKDPKSGRPRSGVSVDDVADALQHPLEIKTKGNADNNTISQKFIGTHATASVNPNTGILIQCNPTDADLKGRLSSNEK